MYQLKKYYIYYNMKILKIGSSRPNGRIFTKSINKVRIL